MRNVLLIEREEDRRAVAAVLVSNGYTVKAGKIKQGSSFKKCLVAEKGDNGDNGTATVYVL